MVEEYDENQKRDLQRMFQIKDKDKSGCLDSEELAECLCLVGMYPTQEDLEFFMKSFDKNGDGQLQISELVDNLHVLHAHSKSEHDVMGAFKAIDRKGKGYIRYTDLEKILLHNGFMSGQDTRNMLSYLSENFDHDGDGKFSYAEFVEVFLSDKFQQEVASKMA